MSLLLFSVPAHCKQTLDALFAVTGYPHWGQTLHSNLSEALYHPPLVSIELQGPEHIHLHTAGREDFELQDSSLLQEGG